MADGSNFSDSVTFVRADGWNHHAGFPLVLPDLQTYFSHFVSNVATRPFINSLFSLADNLASGWGIK